MSEEHLMANVLVGKDLLPHVRDASGFGTRDFLPELESFFMNRNDRRVGVLRGLRRTGKTVAMFHLMSRMPREEFEKTAYVLGRRSDDMGIVHQIMERLLRSGCRWIFFDEVTRVDGFIDNASVFSDIFTASDKAKIVLSGTDSLSLCFSEVDELSGRSKIFRTTHIPFSEHRRLKGSGIDEYLESGGILSDNAASRFEFFKGGYALQAICLNIQRSLEGYQDGRYFMDLARLHRENVLTGVINKVVQSATHEFVANFLNSPFKSRDIGSAADLLRKERNPEKRIPILDIIRGALTERVAKRLRIRNGMSVSDSQIWQIQEYLEMLDLIVPKPLRFDSGTFDDNENVIVQPGLRWAHAVILMDEIAKFPEVANLPERDLEVVIGKIGDDVKGNMLEEAVIVDTMRQLSKIPSEMSLRGRFEVFQQRFRRGGEIDMVVRDRDTDTCALYEIKHAKTICGEQGRHLRDEAKIRFLESKYGRVVERKVLSQYPLETEIDGVSYGGVEEFLLNPGRILELFDSSAPSPTV